MKFTYKTSGTCSTSISFDLEEGVLKNVAFTEGCNGNLKAIGKLVEGRNAREIADLFRGHTCGRRSTSCADQLSQAIDKALAE